MKSILLSVFISILFCSSSNGNYCPNKVSFATFNTGLTPKLLGYDTRRTLIPNTIGNISADVICLQEIWFEDDLQQLLDVNSVKELNSFSTIHNDVNLLRSTAIWSRIESTFFGSPCLTWRLLPLLSCQWWHCNDRSGMDLLRCIGERCRYYLDALPQACITCLAVGMTSLTTGFHKCVPFYRTSNRFNTYGLVLLTTKKIRSAKKYTFVDENVKQVLPRGYIEAEIEDIGTVICTHLTANLSRTISSAKVEYNLHYPSSESQHADEIRALHDKYNGRKHIIMGDLNTGPIDENRDLWGDFPKNYQKLHEYGYVSPYEKNNGKCTYCSYNNVQNNSTRNKLLDHILLHQQTTSQNSKRIFTERSNEWNLSDHFGVEVNICL